MDFIVSDSRVVSVPKTREVEAVIERICDSPEQWRPFEQDVRQCFTRRFPYAVLYTVEEGYILLVAIAHGSRKPGYWHGRIKIESDRARAVFLVPSPGD